MIIYLVRHGETAYNRDGFGLGRMDVPLTERGQAQAHAVGRRLASAPITHVYTSPLDRAASVARAIAGERTAIIPRDELIEMHVGETEGLTFPVMRERHAAFLREWGGESGHVAVMPGGGESIVAVAERVAPFIEELLGSGLETAAVVSHNFVLRVAVCQLLGLPVSSFRTIAFDLASITTVQIERGRVGVHSLNDTCHIADLNVDPAGVSVDV